MSREIGLGPEQLTFQWLRCNKGCLFIDRWIRWFEPSRISHPAVRKGKVLKEIDILALTREKNYIIVSCKQKVEPRHNDKILAHFKSYEAYVKSLHKLDVPSDIEKMLACAHPPSAKVKNSMNAAGIEVITAKEMLEDLIQWLNSEENKGMETQDPMLWLLKTLKENDMLKT